MRWLQRVLGRKQTQQQDPGRQDALLHDVRHSFGTGARAGIPDQVEAATRLLDSDDGLVVAARIVHQFADEAHAELLAQAFDLYQRTGVRVVVDRRHYRPSWESAGSALRWPLFALPCGFHPYAQVAAAVSVVGLRASRFVRVTDPRPLLAHVFELLDLTAVGWQFGGVRVDTDAALLAGRLISTAREVRVAMEDPPPLPPSARDLMRRNNTLDVHDPGSGRVVGAINLGAEMRPALLI
ncbi:hypothetical protein [Micromonospora sp. KLBMP9576]|uniref:hypothetical protein n=1 Tax=Micromonospora sp. KLBMP9576 TaxID=3424769 RepID=UPI003D9207D3